MDAKLEQMEATLNNINVFNAGKKRDEAVALLAQLLPEVESFQAETRAAERKLPEGDQCGSVRTPLKKCSLTADDGASPPMKWCMVAAGVVHWATMRGNYSGMPLRLRMVFSENPL